jgi:hypothetical protein
MSQTRDRSSEPSIGARAPKPLASAAAAAAAAHGITKSALIKRAVADYIVRAK